MNCEFGKNLKEVTMKGIRQERLIMLAMANEEIRNLYELLENIYQTTSCNKTKARVEKFINSKLEINERLLKES